MNNKGVDQTAHIHCAVVIGTLALKFVKEIG